MHTITNTVQKAAAIAVMAGLSVCVSLVPFAAQASTWGRAGTWSHPGTWNTGGVTAYGTTGYANDYYANYSPTEQQSTYSPSSSYSQYAPTYASNTYAPSEYYSNYSPSQYYSNYQPTSYVYNRNITVAPTKVVPVPVPVVQQVPYVTLSQVPYTGLDLGPVGTAAYWGFLVLWCLFMAYLIVVKRVHYRLANTLNGFLFGTDEEEDEEETVEKPAGKPLHSTRPDMPTTQIRHSAADPVDDFILSQVHR